MATNLSPPSLYKDPLALGTIALSRAVYLCRLLKEGTDQRFSTDNFLPPFFFSKIWKQIITNNLVEELNYPLKQTLLWV